MDIGTPIRTALMEPLNDADPAPIEAPTTIRSARSSRRDARFTL
jgi:hypothetical protein